MMNWIRKCLIAVMLTFIMMPAFYSIYFHVSQQLIRWEMWSRVKVEALDVVTIHSSKLNWVEEDREILVNGVMFDVNSIEKAGDSLRITGEYDYRESGLHEELRRVRETEDSEQRELTTVKLLIQVMDDALSRFSPGAPPPVESTQNSITSASTLPKIYLSIQSPPPKA